MEHSLLFGNGLNRLSESFSWENLLKDLSEIQFDEGIPNTIKYEMIISSMPFAKYSKIQTHDGFNIILSDGSYLVTEDKIIEEELKSNIAKKVSEFSDNEIYKKILSFDFANYLTTNYDTALLKSAANVGFKSSPFNVEVCSEIFHCLKFTLNNKEFKYWAIHGIESNPNSIMLGFDQYCDSVSKISTYVKNGDPNLKIDPLFVRLNSNDFDRAKSWVDLFFVSHLHIIGLGLDFTEIDLWWLLVKRKRIKLQYPELIKNKIYFYSPEPILKGKKSVLKYLDIEVVEYEEKTPKISFLNYNFLLNQMVCNINEN